MNDIIANVSDLHINSTTALCAPEVNLDDGGKYQASAGQLVIWQAWLDFWQRFAKLKGNKYVVINGDVVDLTPVQCITNNNADILQMAKLVLEPVLACKPKYLFVVNGTEFHTGAAGWLEEAVAKLLNAEPCSDTGTASWWHLRLKLQDVLIDFSHHTSVGNLPWTESNGLLRLIYEVIAYSSRTGAEVPQLLSRAHVHQHVDTGNAHPYVRAFTTPSWQGKNAYAHRRATNKPTVFGGTFITINNGTYELEHVLYQPRKETTWLLPSH